LICKDELQLWIQILKVNLNGKPLMRDYSPTEFIIDKKSRYIASDTGEELIIFEDVLSGRYYGLPEKSYELEEIRQSFINWLSGKVKNLFGNRKEVLSEIGKPLFQCLTNPKEQEWPKLPADTRPGANRSTLADHSLLTSAIATCLVQEALFQGREIDSIVRITPPLDRDELLNLIRIAGLCHDLGKHPPWGHRERGKEAIEEIFKGVLREEFIDLLTGVALRHHASKYAREAGETPQGFFEEVICYADTASGSDRPTEIIKPDYINAFEEIVQQKEREFPQYPTKGETIYSLVAQLKEWEEKEFKKEKPITLILADVDQIKKYVFETAKLPEVRGASLILDFLNREGPEEKSIAWLLCKKGFSYQGQQHCLPPECIFYAAGGSCLILAPSSLAEQIAHEIERLYLQETGWATISVALLPVHLYELPYGLSPYQNWFDRFQERWEQADSYIKKLFDSYLAKLTEEEEEGIKDPEVKLLQRFFKTKRFGVLTAKLSYELKKKKEERGEIPVIDLTPFARRCVSCEIRPASEYLKDQDQYLCTICKKKRDRGEKKKDKPEQGKGYFVRRFEERLESCQDDWCRKYLEEKEKKNPKIASGLASIGNASTGGAKGYIGLIYADGNDIGAQLEQISTPAEYRHFSSALMKVVETSVFESLAKYLRPVETKNQEEEEEIVHPFEIITIGGDDLFLIVPADRALRMALSICRRFEEEFKEGKRFTMSAGVVIAKSHTPIYFLHKLSEELLKSAKKKSRSEKTGAIDFLVLTSAESAASSLEGIREKIYQVQANSVLEKLSLTERPLTLSELEFLMETAKKIKTDFPRAQLYAIRQALERGRLFSKNFFFYQNARMKEEHRRILDEFIDKWWADSSRESIPFSMRNGEYVTPFVDLIEIIDFAEERLYET
jgi:CRISPR-associated protein Cmr2